MNKRILPASFFNALPPADQLAALRRPTHNWGDHNASKALEQGSAQQRAFEAMAARNTVNEDGTTEILWA